MKKYTLVIFYMGKNHVCSTNDIEEYLKYKKAHYKDLKVLLFMYGDFRRKIRNFGIKRFMDCLDKQDWFKTESLMFEYNSL